MSESTLSRVDFEVARKLLQEEMKAGKYRPIIGYCKPYVLMESGDEFICETKEKKNPYTRQ